AFVPTDAWSSLFLQGHPTLAKFWGPVIGPLVAVISFVCSVGNVPLAAVLWTGGISFGGVISFLFADLIVLPILNIYRRYYGVKMTGAILGIFYVSMVLAALAVEFGFQALGLAPSQRHAQAVETAFRWNYTTFLNIGFLILSVMLVDRFFRTGGPKMLQEMA